MTTMKNGILALIVFTASYSREQLIDKLDAAMKAAGE